MVKAQWSTKMVPNTPVTGRMASKREKESLFIQMETGTKVNSKTTWPMALVFMLMRQQVKDMKDIGKMTTNMVKEKKNIPMDQVMMVSSIKAKKADKELSIGQMEQSTLDSGKMMKSLDTVHKLGLTVENIQDTGNSIR